jgi:transcriptional regulator with XRE-family HTH domain
MAADSSLGFSGDELRDRRRSLDMSQSELAEALGIARNTIARWERADLPIGSPRLVSLALDGLAASLKADHVKPGASAQTATRLVRDPTRTLPTAAEALIGRREELALLHSLLVQPDVRLVTLIGTGGVGKTRLAIEATRACQRAFKHGAAFVDLAPIANAELVPASLASAIGLQEGGRTLLADLIGCLVAAKPLQPVPRLSIRAAGLPTAWQSSKLRTVEWRRRTSYGSASARSETWHGVGSDSAHLLSKRVN